MSGVSHRLGLPEQTAFINALQSLVMDKTSREDILKSERGGIYPTFSDTWIKRMVLNSKVIFGASLFIANLPIFALSIFAVMKTRVNRSIVLLPVVSMLWMAYSYINSTGFIGSIFKTIIDSVSTRITNLFWRAKIGDTLRKTCIEQNGWWNTDNGRKFYDEKIEGNRSSVCSDFHQRTLVVKNHAEYLSKNGEQDLSSIHVWNAQIFRMIDRYEGMHDFKESDSSDLNPDLHDKRVCGICSGILLVRTSSNNRSTSV